MSKDASTGLDAYVNAENALRELTQLTEAARFIVEARAYIDASQDALNAEAAAWNGARVVHGVTAPGEVEDNVVAGLLYQAFNRAGTAREELERVWTALRQPKAA